MWEFPHCVDMNFAEHRFQIQKQVNPVLLVATVATLVECHSNTLLNTLFGRNVAIIVVSSLYTGFQQQPYDYHKSASAVMVHFEVSHVIHKLYCILLHLLVIFPIHIGIF